MLNKNNIAITLLFILFVSTAAAAPENKNWLTEWMQEDTYEGIEVLCRQHKSKINECRYTAITDIPRDTLLAVNIDGPNLKNWMVNLLQTEPFDIKSPFDYKIYSTYNFPGARNRDSVTHSRVTWDREQNSVRLDFESVKHPEKPKDLRFVRYPVIKGFWEFTTLSDGRTKVVYQNIGLPGEYVQKVLYPLYNYSTREAGAKTVANLLLEAQKPEYSDSKIAYPLAKQ